LVITVSEVKLFYLYVLRRKEEPAGARKIKQLEMETMMMRKKKLVLFTVLITISIVFSSFGPSIAFAGTANAGRTDNLNPPVEDGSKDNQIFLPLVRHRQSPTWSMVAANPERTSWTAEEVKGDLKPQWFKVFEPYIPQKVQIIAAYGMLYVSTSAGLYALDSESGAEKWVYATAMPLGHSPTIDSGVAYVGGFDRKLHAISAYTGQRIWTFQAGAGFDTNPLVVEGNVFAGNRDGFFYALEAKSGELAWKFQTQGPIHFSAAYKDGIVYFASNDNYAYALNAQSGKLVWKSDKLLGAGFHSWWPVVYHDTVIFSGSMS